METNCSKNNNWFKFWPGRYLSVIRRIPNQGAHGDILLIAMHMLDEMGLKDDDVEISWVTGLSTERIAQLRPYLDRLKEKDRHDGLLMFDFVLDTIVERQEFADKKAKAGQSGGRPRKAVQSTAKHSEALQSTGLQRKAEESSAKQTKAVQSSEKQTKAIHTNIHVDLDLSRSIADGESPPVSNHKKAPDPRRNHIAITTCRQVASSYPPKELWDDLILLLGDNPDQAKLEACRKEWVKRGYNRASWNWAIEWYPKGAPLNGVRAGPSRESDTYYADGREKPAEKKGFVC